MKIPSNLFSLRVWVLAWFVLAVGAAVASPILLPRTIDIVCAGTGATKILLDTDAGTVELGSHDNECLLCLVSGAPPAPVYSLAPLFTPLAHASALLFISPVVAATAVPPPARGPPVP